MTSQVLQTPINQGLNEMLYHSHRSSRDLKYDCDAKHEITRRSIIKEEKQEPQLMMTQRDTMKDLQELVTEYTGNTQNSLVNTHRTFSKNVWSSLDTNSLDLKAKIRPQTGAMSSSTRIQNIIQQDTTSVIVQEIPNKRL